MVKIMVKNRENLPPKNAIFSWTLFAHFLFCGQKKWAERQKFSQNHHNFHKIITKKRSVDTFCPFLKSKVSTQLWPGAQVFWPSAQMSKIIHIKDIFVNFYIKEYSEFFSKSGQRPFFRDFQEVKITPKNGSKMQRKIHGKNQVKNDSKIG